MSVTKFLWPCHVRLTQRWAVTSMHCSSLPTIGSPYTLQPAAFSLEHSVNSERFVEWKVPAFMVILTFKFNTHTDKNTKSKCSKQLSMRVTLAAGRVLVGSAGISCRILPGRLPWCRRIVSFFLLRLLAVWAVVKLYLVGKIIRLLGWFSSFSISQQSQVHSWTLLQIQDGEPNYVHIRELNVNIWKRILTELSWRCNPGRESELNWIIKPADLQGSDILPIYVMLTHLIIAQLRVKREMLNKKEASLSQTMYVISD